MGFDCRISSELLRKINLEKKKFNFASGFLPDPLLERFEALPLRLRDFDLLRRELLLPDLDRPGEEIDLLSLNIVISFMNLLRDFLDPLALRLLDLDTERLPDFERRDPLREREPDGLRLPLPDEPDREPEPDRDLENFLELSVQLKSPKSSYLERELLDPDGDFFFATRFLALPSLSSSLVEIVAFEMIREFCFGPSDRLILVTVGRPRFRLRLGPPPSLSDPPSSFFRFSRRFLRP